LKLLPRLKHANSRRERQEKMRRKKKKKKIEVQLFFLQMLPILKLLQWLALQLAETKRPLDLLEVLEGDPKHKSHQ
jgi:hypothetical protein